MVSMVFEGVRSETMKEGFGFEMRIWGEWESNFLMTLRGLFIARSLDHCRLTYWSLVFSISKRFAEIQHFYPDSDFSVLERSQASHTSKYQM
jgi:hypothetical protein